MQNKACPALIILILCTRQLRCWHRAAGYAERSRACMRASSVQIKQNIGSCQQSCSPDMHELPVELLRCESRQLPLRIGRVPPDSFFEACCHCQTGPELVCLCLAPDLPWSQAAHVLALLFGPDDHFCSELFCLQTSSTSASDHCSSVAFVSLPAFKSLIEHWSP